MTKIAFWNLRRLGSGSDGDRKIAIQTVFTNIGADRTLFCELTTTSTFPLAVNLTYRQPNDRQLCYGGLDNVGHDIVINKYTPSATDDYKKASFKGGNNITQLADRAVGFIGQVDGVDIYVIHAPSGGLGRPGRKVMSFIACDLNHTYQNKSWLIIGDFNVEPGMLKQAPVGIVLEDLIHATASNEPTFIGPQRYKTYDYVLCNFDVTVSRIRASPRHHGSDHYPIVVKW